MHHLIGLGAVVDFGPSGNELWFAAAEGGVGFLVEEALERGVPVDHRPTLRAVGRGVDRRTRATEPAGRLLDAGARLTEAAVVGAAAGNHTELLGDLLARGGGPDSRRHGRTAYAGSCTVEGSSYRQRARSSDYPRGPVTT